MNEDMIGTCSDDALYDDEFLIFLVCLGISACMAMR